MPRVLNLLSVLLAATVSPILADPSSSVSIECLPRHATSLGAQLVMYGARHELEFGVSLTNDEGEESLRLSDDLGTALVVDLRLEDHALFALDVESVWSGAERFSTHDPLRAPPGLGLLEPGFGIRTTMLVRRRDGEPFPPGNYRISLRLAQGVRTATGDPWTGRGARGSALFEVREIRSLDDQKHAWSSQAGRAFGEGRYEEALRLYAAIYATDPGAPFACVDMAYALFRLAEYRDAAACFEQWMDHPQADPLMGDFLVFCYLAVGETARAAATLRRFMRSEARVQERLDRFQAHLPAVEQ